MSGLPRPPGEWWAVVELAARQHGVVSTQQLAALGFDEGAVRWRADVGILHRIYHGVYVVGTRRISRRGRWMAAVLACGDGAALSHRSAAGLRGLRPGGGAPEVTVPRSREGIEGIRICRSRLPLEVEIVDGIPVTTVARTLLDLAAVVSYEQLAKAVDRAERLEVFDLGSVIDVLAHGRGRKGARALRRAIIAWDPRRLKSELERRLRRLIERSDLPTPTYNEIVAGEKSDHEVDAYFERAGLAVQVDGWQFHRTRRDRERDAAADSDLELAGVRVMRLTWDDVTVRGAASLRRIGAIVT